MKKRVITNTYFSVENIDSVGGILRTDVFLKDGIFRAFSFYIHDAELTLGYGESKNPDESIEKSL